MRFRNINKQKSLRKQLRNIPTHYEYVLWKYLKNRQMNGYKFRRQYSFGFFVVDFYCPELSLAIEVDGANHFYDKKSIEYDTNRQKFIEKFEVRFLRFGNDEIRDNITGVLETILEATRTSPNPSLERRGKINTI